MFGQFRLATDGGSVAISDTTITGSATSEPTASEAGVRFGNDGKIYQRLTDGGAWSFHSNWLVPPSANAVNYELMAAVDSGSLTTGTTGSWLSLASNRDFTKRATSNTGGPRTVVFTVQIRHGSGPTLDTAQFTLVVEVTP